MSREPQDEIYAVVGPQGELTTQSASKRWAFRSLYAARNRVSQDMLNGHDLRAARVARYKFDGWA